MLPILAVWGCASLLMLFLFFILPAFDASTSKPRRSKQAALPSTPSSQSVANQPARV